VEQKHIEKFQKLDNDLTIYIYLILLKKVEFN